ncbi:MAG TPA: IPT/TIG domain-containing protein [Thermoleophilia bacterium]|nr:IPT/TIG domain-containing protein [Thermoleophilia bacterium]
MGQKSRRDRGRMSRIAVAALVVAAAIVILAAVTPREALAQLAYIHGGIAVEDCETCHVNAHTWWTPTNEHCLGCHPGFQVPDTDLTCWTCHAPGQDMSASRVDAACTAACHLRDGSTVTHQAHAGASDACTSCHPVSASPSEAAGSAHHTVPPPVVAAMTPAFGLPGAQVTLAGSRFTGTTAVSFNGVLAVFAVDSDTRITAVVPPGATSGPVSVISRGGKGAGPGAFTVTVVSSLTLRAGPAIQTLGRRVRLGGTLQPLGRAGTTLKVFVQQRRGGAWRTVRAVSRDTSTAGVFAWSYAPPRRGAYRAAASLAASPASTAARSRWVTFRIR